MDVLIDGQPETITLGQLVSGDYYAGLGVSAIIGRTLTPADDLPAAPAVAVISYRYWEARFGRNPAVVGKTIQVNRVPVTLIGVTPATFVGAMQVGESADITLALAQHTRVQPDRAASRAQPWYWWIRVMGRLAPDATAAQAAASLEPAFQQAAREGWLAGRALDRGASSDMPELSTLAADPGGQGENDRRRDYLQSLRVLMGLAGLVLLAACANVANLLLVRGAVRRREIAVGSPSAPAGPALSGNSSQSVCCSLSPARWRALSSPTGPGASSSGSASLAALRQCSTFRSMPAFSASPSPPRPRQHSSSVLLPALRTTRLDLATEFQSGSRLLGDAGRSRLGQSLMILQIALSLVLLIITGLFIHTLRNLQNVDPGFNPRGLVLFRIDAGSAGYTPPQFVALQEGLRQRLENIPGVGAATFARVALLAQVRSNRRISVPGYTPAPGETMIFNLNGIAPDFLAAMEIPLVLGRPFDARDATDAAPVAIVNQVFSRKFFGESSPIGRTSASVAATQPTGRRTLQSSASLAMPSTPGCARRLPPRSTCLPPRCWKGPPTITCAPLADAASVVPGIRAAVREIDPTLPVIDLHTQDEQIERLTSQERLFARLSGFFGVLTLILSSVGLYGLMSFLVLRRTGEIGLRIALGALPAHVLRMILRDALTLVGLGLVLGVTAAFGAGRLIAIAAL